MGLGWRPRGWVGPDHCSGALGTAPSACRRLAGEGRWSRREPSCYILAQRCRRCRAQPEHDAGLLPLQQGLLERLVTRVTNIEVGSSRAVAAEDDAAVLSTRRLRGDVGGEFQ